MNKIGIDNIKIDNLNIEIVDEDNIIRIVFKGKIDSMSPTTTIFPYLDEIHNKILELKIKEIAIDFSALEYTNSSGIRTFLMLFNKDNSLSKDEQYKILLIYSKENLWQDSLFSTFEHLNKDLIKIKKV